jgi:hypothetical protein
MHTGEQAVAVSKDWQILEPDGGRTAALSR